jgi:putative ABC transport system permease protein
MYWMRESKAGVALLFTSGLALLVGLVITSHTLYAATVASLREYALLRALGISLWRIGGLILAQSFWVGLGGVIVAAPLVYGMVHAIQAAGGRVILSPLLLGGTAGVTLVMALASGLYALRSLRLFEPVVLLR